jgi:hypothetical protein
MQKASLSLGKTDEIFQKMLDAVIHSQAESEIKSQLSATIEEMRGSHGTSSFRMNYQSFTSILADHIQIFGPLLAPYLLLLAQMIVV